MTSTIYTIHRAEDAAILATAEPGNLQAVVATVDAGIANTEQSARRAYIHNGRGIVAAGLIRQGLWHDSNRHEFIAAGCEASAANAREEAGYPIDAEHAPRRRFAVEYRTNSGGLRCARVIAHNVDDARERFVATYRIDFDAIQSIEERGA